MKKFVVGQRIKLEGVIKKRTYGYEVQFDGDENHLNNNVSDRAMQHAKIIAEPEVKFTKEQVGALKSWTLYSKEAKDTFSSWLDAHTE
jgi:hypothetical protein